jgi:putative flippase GtrA
MRSARQLLERVRGLVPEAFAFGVIGAGNTLLYLLIVYVFAGIGAVKASVIATVVTTTLAYLANRHWTYRHRPRATLRREYTLFFGFNLAGMVIQSGTLAATKYGLGLTERDDLHVIMGFTLVGIALATVFRFWAYRTFVFLKPRPGSELVELDPAAGLAEVTAEVTADITGPRRPAEDLDDVDLEAELVAELDAERRTPR